MSTLDDLLSQRRRAPLSETDERRVQIAVRSSRDHQLALLAGEAFDRAGAPQPGDAELVRKIVRQVEGEWSGTFQRQPLARPRWSRWAAVPTLIAGVAAASWGGERLWRSLQPSSPEQLSLRQPAAAPRALPPGAQVVAPAPAPVPAQSAALPEPRADAPARAAVTEPTAESSRLGGASSSSSAGSARATASSASSRRAVSSGAESSGAVLPGALPRAASPGVVLPRAVPQRSSSAAAPAGAEVAADETARSLFLRANRLRRSDWTAAAELYEELIRRFARSEEAGVAEMALGKHALSEGHPERALSWFRAYQRRPDGELLSEALWGEARALESLGETAAARAVWRRLLSEYPGSAYAAVARQQLGS